MLSSFGPVSALSALATSLSDEQKQRIGIARAFFHGGQFMLLDEITANLDALNEGIILKSLKEAAKDKTIIIVSRRTSRSTLKTWVKMALPTTLSALMAATMRSASTPKS